MCTYLCMYVSFINIYMYMLYFSSTMQMRNSHTYPFMYIYIYIYLHVYISIYLSICLYIYVYMYMLPFEGLQEKSLGARQTECSPADAGAYALCADAVLSSHACMYVLYVYIGGLGIEVADQGQDPPLLGLTDWGSSGNWPGQSQSQIQLR